MTLTRRDLIKTAGAAGAAVALLPARGLAAVPQARESLRILFIGVVAYVVFEEFLKTNEWLGMLVIISSTLYIAQREYRLGKRLTGGSGL